MHFNQTSSFGNFPVPPNSPALSPRDTRRPAVKRRRDSQEEQNQRVQELCEQALTEVSTAIGTGWSYIPDSAQRAFYEAKRINPNHPRVQQIEVLLSAPPDQQHAFICPYFEAEYKLDLAIERARRDINANMGMPQVSLEFYREVKQTHHQHPKVLEFELEFENWLS